MKHHLVRSAILGIAASVVMSASAVAADYKVTSLDWPPYTHGNRIRRCRKLHQKVVNDQ